MRGSAVALALLVLMGTLRLASAQQAAEESPPAAVNPNPLSSLSLESLTATRSLPLFTPSRTAPVVDAPVQQEVEVAAPVEPEPEPEEAPPPLQLVGIVLTGSTQTALLRNPSTDEVLRLAPGEEFDHWAVKIVDARSIELRRGDRVHGLKMFEIFPAAGIPGELFGEGMPVEMNAEPPMEGFPPDDLQDMPVDPDAPPLDPSAPDGASGADFAPELGGAPIPEEGAPAPEGDTNVNQ